MKRLMKINTLLIASALALTSCVCEVPASEESIQTEGMTMENIPEGLVLQDLDYSEAPVDIPNPDRGFYRANDGMVVPVAGEGEEGTQMEVGEEPVTVGGAQVTTRVSHVYFRSVMRLAPVPTFGPAKLFM